MKAADYPQQGMFRMRLVVVQAFRYQRGVPFPDWFVAYFDRWPRRIQQVDAHRYDISCADGWRILAPGMWCVLRPSGGVSVISPEDFFTAYEPLPPEDP